MVKRWYTHKNVINKNIWWTDLNIRDKMDNGKEIHKWKADDYWILMVGKPKWGLWKRKGFGWIKCVTYELKVTMRIKSVTYSLWFSVNMGLRSS